MFIDTIKYFQQSLGALASNLTNKEKASIRKKWIKFIEKDLCFARKCNLCSEEDKNGYLIIYRQAKSPFHMKWLLVTIPLIFHLKEEISIRYMNFSRTLKMT